MKKIFAEIGFGNDSFLSTEFEEDEKEYRIPKFILPKNIDGVFFRFWIFKKVFILSTNQGLKIKHKDKNKLKILFGISGEDGTDDYSMGYLGKIVNITIDRPLNSKHPKHNFIYEVNYGFVSGTKAPDGEELDAYLIGVNNPVSEYTGKCIAIIHRLDNDDDKLIIIPTSVDNIADEEIIKKTYFQERWFKSVIVRK